jgi:type IV secretion system protein VirB7
MSRSFIPLVLILLALTACSSGEELASCKGPVFQLNTGRWSPAPAEVAIPEEAR